MTKTMLAIGFVLLSAATSSGQNLFQPTGLTTRGISVPSADPNLPPSLTLTIPAETVARIEMLSGLHTRVSHVDDPVEARLMRPVVVNGKIALPYGTLIEGHITQIQSAGFMRRPAQLAFRFDRISLPDGQSASITAVLSSPIGSDLKDAHVDNEGNLKGARGFSWKGIVGGIAAVGSLASIKAAVGGAASLAYAVPVGGAAFLGYELLLSRGTDVHVPPETEFRIRLSYPITVRVRG
jgi:hypothetical protein